MPVHARNSSSQRAVDRGDESHQLDARDGGAGLARERVDRSARVLQPGPFECDEVHRHLRAANRVEMQSERAYAGQATVALAHTCGDGAGEVQVVVSELAVHRHQRVARTHGHRAERRMRARGSGVGPAPGERVAPHVGQGPAVGIGGVVEERRQCQRARRPRREGASRLHGLVACALRERDERHHVERSEPGMHTGMTAQVHVFRHRDRERTDPCGGRRPSPWRPA